MPIPHHGWEGAKTIFNFSHFGIATLAVTNAIFQIFFINIGLTTSEKKNTILISKRKHNRKFKDMHEKLKFRFLSEKCHLCKKHRQNY